MVLKNKRNDDVTQLKTTHVYTDVAQGCLKVNTDKTWPKQYKNCPDMVQKY